MLCAVSHLFEVCIKSRHLNTFYCHLMNAKFEGRKGRCLWLRLVLVIAITVAQGLTVSHRKILQICFGIANPRKTDTTSRSLKRLKMYHYRVSEHDNSRDISMKVSQTVLMQPSKVLNFLCASSNLGVWSSTRFSPFNCMKGERLARKLISNSNNLLFVRLT